MIDPNIGKMITVPPSMEELLSAVDRSDYAIAITTYDFRNPVIVHTNKKHEDLTGYTRQELVGKNPRLFQGLATNRKTVEELKNSLLKYDSWDGYFINYDKWSKPFTVQLIIFGVSLSTGEKLYVAVKQSK